MQYRDETWWTYLDGEMTSAESTAFDQSLTPEERQRLDHELRFECDLGEALSARVPCPRDTWAAAKAALKKATREQRRCPHWVRWSLLLGLPAVAGLIIIALGVFPGPTESEPAFLALNGKNVAEMEAHSQVADGVAGVRAFMEKCSLPIELDPADPLDGQSTPYKLLGAREDHFRGERVVQLFFDCEGHAAVLVIARGAGQAADEIGKAFAKGDIRAARAIGDVVVAVVGTDAPRDLIRVVGENWPAPEPEVTDGTESSPPSDDAEATAPDDGITRESAEAASEPPEAVPPAEAGPETPPALTDDVPSTIV